VGKKKLYLDATNGRHVLRTGGHRAPAAAVLQGSAAGEMAAADVPAATAAAGRRAMAKANARGTERLEIRRTKIIFI